MCGGISSGGRVCVEASVLGVGYVWRHQFVLNCNVCYLHKVYNGSIHMKIT